MTIRVLVVGAGAIGAFYGSRLALAPKTLVSVLCRSNYEAVKTKGFTISSPIYGQYAFRPHEVFNSLERAADAANYDYLLVSTKALPDINDDSKILRNLVKPKTSIVLAQNGVGIEEPYQNRFPEASVISAVAYPHAVQSRPGHIQHHAWTKMSVGPYIGSTQSAVSHRDDKEEIWRQTSRFFELLKAGNVDDAELHDAKAMQHVRWSKLAINAAMNCTSVLCGFSDNPTNSNDPDVYQHLLAVMYEVLGAARQILGTAPPTTLPIPEESLKLIQKSPPGSKSSMLVDWEADRPMEVEVILGNAIRLAQQSGITMPRVETMYALLKRMQRNRDMLRSKISKV